MSHNDISHEESASSTFDETTGQDVDQKSDVQTFQDQASSNPTTPFFRTRKAAGLMGGLAGLGVFGLTLYTAPAVVQAATYAIAGALAGVLGASVGVYIAAMVAVAAAAAILGALVALAIRSACQHFSRPGQDNRAQPPKIAVDENSDTNKDKKMGL